MKRILLISSAVVLVLVLILAIFLRLRFGGGKTYPDLSTTPRLPQAALEAFFAFDEPIGNVAASRDTSYPTRVFFTVHPESRPEKIKLLEIKDGKAVPYPSEAEQAKFKTPLGLYVDRQQRLWVIDHGNHAIEGARLLAFDLQKNALIHEYTFPDSIAEKGSFFNDLSVTPDGNYVFVADVSFFAKKPSLIVYDIARRQARSLLDGHPSVTSQGYVPVTPAKKMRFFGGLVDLMPGIDGLDVDGKGEYVYWAAMSHESLCRLPVATATDFNLSDNAIYNKVETVSKKPLSDGIRVDTAGNVLITDIEHQGIYVVAPDGKGQTLLRDARIRWADGLSYGSDGYWYLADSDIPNQMLQSKKHIMQHQPYYIFRFKY
ncbi:MAG: L-dopachrome tautomerase-related protein [Saprospiraceae bacterium]